jgi:hypothetical protein
MKGLRFTRRKIAIASAVAVLGAGGVIGYAYFTSTGSGTGNGTVGSASNYAVTVDTASGSALFPGSGSQNTAYHVKNTSTGFQNLSSITAALTADGAGDVFNTTTSATAVGCKAAWFTVTNHPGTLPDDLAGGATHDGSADITMQDSGTNQDACQGVTPQITISAA